MTTPAIPAEELFSHIFQASPMAIAISILETGRFVEVNQAFQELTGYCRSEAIGRTSLGLGLYYTPEDRQELVEALRISGTVRGREATMRTKSGQLRRVQVFLELIDVAQRPHILTFFIDITNRVLVAEAQTQAMLDERQRLARDLHDSVTQSLYSLTLLTEAARRLAGAGDLVRVEDLLGRLGDTALLALKEMRLLVYQLRPPILEQVGLVGALQRRLDSVERRAGIQGRLLIEGNVALQPQLEEGLYFIAQEALNNALKHSKAADVTVILHAMDSVVELEIVDNGQGFDLEAARGQGGLGLSGMIERTQALSGQLHITSQPGHGTSIRVRVPLTGQGAADGLDDPGLGSAQLLDPDCDRSPRRGLTGD